MVLARYLLTRFFLYLFSLTTGITLLFNLIEFFEKMVRTTQATTGDILYFVSLNAIPSFFNNLAIGTWLAICMLLREMHQQHEWETLALLNVSLRPLLKIFAFAGSILVLFSFVGKEHLASNLAHKAELFKQEQFKQQSNKKLFNQWFSLDEQSFCHFPYLDLETGIGSDFEFFELSNQFTLEKIISAPTFTIDTKTKKIRLLEGVSVLAKEKTHETFEKKEILLPTFFTQLTMQSKAPKLKQIFHLLVLDKKLLPTHVHHNLLYDFLSRILSHLLLLIYPILTLLFFFVAPHRKHYRWILILLPYPITILLTTVTDSLMQTIQNGWLALLPYLTLTFLIVTIYRFIKK